MALKYVLDASVAVAAIRSNEPSHAKAVARCRAISTGADEIIVPSIFEVEVVVALVRRSAPRSLATRFLEEHFGARNVFTLGLRAARSASRVAALARLQAADAIYVWLAAREDIPLVTLDNEVIARAPSVGVSATTP